MTLCLSISASSDGVVNLRLVILLGYQSLPIDAETARSVGMGSRAVLEPTARGNIQDMPPSGVTPIVCTRAHT